MRRRSPFVIAWVGVFVGEVAVVARTAGGGVEQDFRPAFAEAGEKSDRRVEVDGPVGLVAPGEIADLEQVALEGEVEDESEHGADERPEAAEPADLLASDLVVELEAAGG